MTHHLAAPGLGTAHWALACTRPCRLSTGMRARHWTSAAPQQAHVARCHAQTFHPRPILHGGPPIAGATLATFLFWALLALVGVLVRAHGLRGGGVVHMSCAAAVKMAMGVEWPE